MSPVLRRPTSSAFLVLSALVACTPLHAAAPDAPVTIRVVSGREFTGRVLPRSDAERLWLRLAASDSILSIDRPIAWNQIAAVRVGDETVPLAEWRAKLPLAPIAEPVVPREPQASRPPIRTSQVFVAPKRAVDVVTEVWLDNWDMDQEIDGLSVLVAPLTYTGEMFATQLTVEAEVLAPRHRSQNERPTTAGWGVEQIARCSTMVRAEQFGPRGALVRLPFQWPGPEMDSTLSRYALVKLRIGIPGSGVFERSYDGVRLRPWTPTRDLLQQWTGSRYLPAEQRPWSSSP